MSDVENAGFDEWLDAAEAGDAYCLECDEGHASLPPRRVCPDCGSTELSERSLPDTGEVQTFTITHVPTPSFEKDAPYATAIATFGPVGVTGQVTGLPLEDVENGLSVSIDVSTSKTTGDRILVFTPA